MSVFEKIYDGIVEGLTILRKYPDPMIHAEHDVIYAGPGSDDVISESDAKRLEELGWSKCDEGGWSRYT